MLFNDRLCLKLDAWTKWSAFVVCSLSGWIARLKRGNTSLLTLHTLGFFNTQIEKADIPMRPLTAAAYSSRARSAQEVDDLEEKLKEHESRILQMNGSYETLQRRYLQLTELCHVLRESGGFFEQVGK